MNQQSEHLSDAQIEQYGKSDSGAGPETEAWVETHLDDCPLCRGRVLDFQRTRFALLPDPKVKTVPTSACPSEDDLRNLAAGLCSEPIAQKLKAHAATCNHCGPLLREYTEDFSDNFTPEEHAVLDQLSSASPKWQQQTAREMLKEAKKNPEPVPAIDWRRFFSWKWIMVPALPAVALIAFGLWYLQRDTPEKAEKDLAQSYTQKRTIEMRWPGAEWGRSQITLGPSESVFSKPGSLIDAEKMIKDHRTTSSGDSKWLRARAEVEILEGNPGDAIQLLDPVVQANSNSVSLLLDLALAYSQQFKISRNRHDSEKAFDLLNQALKKEPENRTALFNLAIAYADNEMWDEAVSTWNRYLLIEKDPKWAEEAKERRDKAREKLHSTLRYPSYPSDLVTSFLALNDDEIAFRLEQYQEIVLRNWLPKAVVNPAGLEHQAVARLAQVSEDHSHDLWWRDFLDHISAGDFTGVEALSAAFVDNTKGHYREALKQTSRALKVFYKRNPAGELRARYEAVYAQRRWLHGKNCLARAGPLQAQLALTSYTWMQSQLGMEMAICLNYVDDLKESSAVLSQSLSIAQKSHLPLAVLRNIGFAQSLNNQQGNYETALDEGINGLHAYWEGPPSTERVYQFYAGFSLSTEDLGLWAAAEAFLRHAIDILSTEHDEIQRGAALLELSKILAAEKEDDAAEAAALKANQLLDAEVKEPTSRSYRLVAKIGLAELQLKHGKAQEALAVLEPASELLSETDGYFVLLHFYRLSGNINLALRHLDKAASAYQQAIVIAEKALPGIKIDQKRLDWILGAEDAYRGLVRVLIEQYDTNGAWKLWEWYISRSYPENLIAAVRKQSRPAEDWPELWATISAIPVGPARATRAVYAVFDDGMEIWSAAQDKLKATWVPVRREDLRRMTQQFSQACARKDSSLQEVQKLGRELFALLMQPVSEELPANSLIRVELDRSLSALPIEALRSPEGWYLGEKYPIIHSPGILYERHLRQPANVSSGAPFLLADAAENSFLPGHDLERSTIQKLFPKTTVLGPEANSATIMAPLGNSVAFGFIGHGEPYSTGTGLRMNPHLLLQADDFSAKTLRHLQLAVLAACSTGSSGSDGLLDNRSLVHAFLAGGVPSVVASRWNVDSEATAILMSNFYTTYASHQSATAALFSARNQLLKTYSHPYYWAGFSLTGKAN